MPGNRVNDLLHLLQHHDGQVKITSFSVLRDHQRILHEGHRLALEGQWELEPLADVALLYAFWCPTASYSWSSRFFLIISPSP